MFSGVEKGCYGNEWVEDLSCECIANLLLDKANNDM